MSNSHIEGDYLVIGAGATAMAFVDTLLAHSDATVVMVDRHHRPGGHWNDAYSFVRLHQPSSYYGVDSRPLGTGTVDTVGFNRGLLELASGQEVLDYFEQVMNHRFLASGRVQYFPMCDATVHDNGEATITSLLTGEQQRVVARKKLVNGTLARTEVPATHPPRYQVAEGVTCIPLNALPAVRKPHSGYVVVGAGKTGIDACLWLLGHGVPPDRIRWIMPRDAWMLDRTNFQTRPENFERHIGGLVDQFEAILAARTTDDVFTHLESCGQLVRLDPAVTPTMYHCCTVSPLELDALRQIRQVIRLGRVTRVDREAIVLEQGAIPNDADQLIIDCSASALHAPPDAPVFDGRWINLVMLRTCQPTFSAALIGVVEAQVSEAAQQNALCRPVPVPSVPTDWLRMWAVTLQNRVAWAQHDVVNTWVGRSRLDSLAVMARTIGPEDDDKKALLGRFRSMIGPVATHLPSLLSQIPA